MADENGNSSLPTFHSMDVSDKGHGMSTSLQMYLDHQFQYTNRNLSPNGYVVPGFTTTEINNFASNNEVLNGTLWIDTQTGKLKFKWGGTIRTVSSAP